MPCDDDLGVALEHRRDGLQAAQDLVLGGERIAPSSASGCSVIAAHRRRVGRVEAAELALERVAVELVGGDVLGRQRDELRLHPRDRTLRGAHDLVQRDDEAEVVRGRATTRPRTRRGS